MRGRLRAADWILMAVCIAAYGVFLANLARTGFPGREGWIPMAVTSARSEESYPTVSVHAWARSRPVEAGDVLLAVDGDDLRGRTALFVYDRATRALRSHGAVPIRVERSGRTFEARLEPDSYRIWWPPLVFAIALLGTAAAIWILAPGWHLGRRYFLACWCYAVISSQAGPYPVSIFAGSVFMTLLPVGSALTAWNAAEFTLSARPVPRVLHVLVAVTFVLGLVLGLSNVLPFSMSARRLAQAAHTLCFSGTTLAGLTRAYFRSTPLERRQVRWVLLGFYVALSGFVALALVPGRGVATAAFVAGLAIPASGVVAIVGYRWLDVDPLISAVASYSVVGLGVLGGALAFVPRAAAAAAQAVGMSPDTSQWLLTMGLLAVAVPVHRFLRPRIDRRLFAARHARTLGFERLLDEIGRCASVEELTRLPAERFGELLDPESIATYAREETAFTPVLVRGRGAPPAFDAASPLVTTLERRHRPLAVDAEELDAFDRAALETLGVSVIVPTRRGDTLVAFSCLGRKRSGDIYTPEELAYMTAVANRCAEVLVKLDDEVVIREARELQHSLRRYVPGAVAEEIAGGRELAAEEREVTVLFVDLRGYTSLSERRSAEETFSTLNEYTETVSRIVRERGGTVVEFHGDGLMAVFGAPRPLEAKERAAVEAARDVVGALAGRLEVGIGVATGPAFVGNLRAADRLIWSAIGNTTNLAARLQTATRELGAAIAIDPATEARAGYVCADFERHPQLAIRGRSERLDVWALPLERVRARPTQGA